MMMKETLSLQASLIVELEKFEKTWKKQRIGLDKTANLVYNTGMNNNKENKMSNLDKLINYFLLRGHSWIRSVQLAKSTLTIIENGDTLRLRASSTRDA